MGDGDWSATWSHPHSSELFMKDRDGCTTDRDHERSKPQHPVSQNCFSILQQSLAICGLKQPAVSVRMQFLPPAEFDTSCSRGGGGNVCVFLTNRSTDAGVRTIMKSQHQLCTFHFTCSLTRLRNFCRHFNTYFSVHK